jgi:hypothetical protein
LSCSPGTTSWLRASVADTILRARSHVAHNCES